MDDHERTVKPKPKLTKAERRELQEKQRAAKSARIPGDGHAAGAPKPHSAKPAQAHAASTPAGLGHTAGQVMLHLAPDVLCCVEQVFSSCEDCYRIRIALLTARYAPLQAIQDYCCE